MSKHKGYIDTRSHTKEVFTNIRDMQGFYPGKGLHHKYTTMMVQATEDMGADSATPTDSHSTPIITQPSSSKPQKKKSRRKQRKDSAPTEPTTEETTPEEHVSTLPMLHLQVGFGKEKALITSGLRRLRKVGSSSKVESSNDASLGAQEDASKQGRKIEDLDADVEVILVNETQEMNDDKLMFDTVTSVRPRAKGIIFHDQEEHIPASTKTFSSSQSQLPQVKDKGKGKMVEPEVPLKKKDQVALDEEMARNLEAQLQAELIEEERLARQKEEEANIALIESWDNTQAMMEADFELAQRLQAEEQGEITIEERSRLFVELMNRRKKHFAKLRAEEIRRKPPTKAQNRNQMSTYLKNMAGYKHEVENAAQIPIATTVAPGMFKLDLDPLAPRSQPTGNKKNDGISQKPSSNRKNKVRIRQKSQENRQKQANTDTRTEEYARAGSQSQKSQPSVNS
ncbi:hypothetical protein Tco_1188604 [Tanacetum coccineum]